MSAEKMSTVIEDAHREGRADGMTMRECSDLAAERLHVAGFVHETEALTIDELYRVAGHLAGDGTTGGLILADMLNKKFGASARRRGKAWTA